MIMRKGNRKGLFLVLVVVLAAAGLLLYSRWSEGQQQLDNLIAFESGPGEGTPDDEEIQELKDGIAAYRKEAERTIKASQDLGTYYRLLASEYMVREMYGQALESLEKAVEYYPAKTVLFYYAGICAGQMSKAALAPEKAQEYRDRAERSYKRALSLDPEHEGSLYGLSILYLFEMDRPFDARPLLERLLKKRASHFEAMLLLARVYWVEGKRDEAAALYERIINESGDEELKRKASDNLDTLMERAYGG